jgi:hypothetical protein
VELARVILYPVGFLALFTALGAAPVVLLGRRLRGRGALMPIVGLALAAILLTDASPLIPMRTAAWAVLLPAALLSVLLALAVRLSSGSFNFDKRDFGAVAVLSLSGSFIALIPALRAKTPGPLALYVYDALQYLSVDAWLRDNTLEASVQQADTHNLALLYGHATLHAGGGGWRLGADAVNTAASTLMQASASETQFALLAVFFGLGAAAAWFVVRSLGFSPFAASVSATFAFSAAFLVIVYDTQLGNIAGLTIAPVTVACFFHCVRTGDKSIFALTSITLGGLLALYPEFLLPTLAASLVAVLGAVIGDTRPLQPLSSVASRILTTFLFVIVLAVALAPVPAWRAANYLLAIVQGRQTNFGVPRPIGVETFLPWVFGIAHLYELHDFEAVGSLAQAFALALAVAMAGAIVASSVGRRAAWVGFVATPIVVAFVIGVASGSYFSSGKCEYCQWKAWTFMLPFIGVGLGFVVNAGQSLTNRHTLSLSSQRRARWVVRLCVAGALAVPVYILGSTDARLIATAKSSPARVGANLRHMVSSASRARGRAAGIWLDGSDADPAPTFYVPATYQLLNEAGIERISFDARNPITVAYLGSPNPDQYRPDYTLVFSPFAGLQSARPTLARAGNYVLQRRAEIDVGLAGEGIVLDPRDGAHAIPWVAAPFELWVSSPSRRSGSIIMSLQRPSGSDAWLKLVARSHPLRIVRISDDVLCADVEFGAGRTEIGVIPTFEPLSRSEGIPKVLGIRSLRADRHPCSRNVSR